MGIVMENENDSTSVSNYCESCEKCEIMNCKNCKRCDSYDSCCKICIDEKEYVENYNCFYGEDENYFHCG